MLAIEDCAANIHCFGNVGEWMRKESVDCGRCGHWMHFVWKHENDSQLDAHRLLFHWLCEECWQCDFSVEQHISAIRKKTKQKKQTKKNPVTTLQANLAK